MFKLVVLSALLAVASARPGLYESSPVVYSAPIVQETSYAKVGAIVKSVPTGVFHQNSSVVHDSAQIVEPIVAPLVKTYASAPVIKTYAAAPVLKTYAAAPVIKSYAAAPLVQTYAAAPVLKTYASDPLTIAAPAVSYAAAPVAYGHGW